MNSAPMITSTMPTPRRGRWWRGTLWLLLALCVLVVAAGLVLVDHFDPTPMQISIDGAPLVTDFNLAALPPAHKVVLTIGIAVALLVALVIALGSVVVALVALVPIVLLAVALPVLIAGLVLALVLSPFALLVWLLWRALRPTAARSTTMAA